VLGGYDRPRSEQLTMWKECTLVAIGSAGGRGHRRPLGDLARGVVLTGRRPAWRSAASRAAVLACPSARSTMARQCTLRKSSPWPAVRASTRWAGGNFVSSTRRSHRPAHPEPAARRAGGAPEYCPDQWGVLPAIVRVTPNAGVNGAACNRCTRG
jgi:hypothetical protein